MPEYRRVVSEADDSGCGCGEDVILSNSFPPFYTHTSCGCSVQDERIPQIEKDPHETGKICLINIRSTIDSGCSCESKNEQVYLHLSNEYRGISGDIQHVDSHEDDVDLMWVPDEDGDTILHLAVIHGDLRLVMDMLSTVGASRWIDHHNILRQTSLHLSVLSQHLLITKLLLQQGAHPQLRDRHGNTALHLACRLGDVEAVKVLMAREIHCESQSTSYVNLLNYDGLTCLHVAASGGHTHVIRCILETRHVTADINMADGCSGRTILHNAAENRDMGLLCYLLQCQTDIPLDLDAVTYSGHTAFDLAKENNHEDVTEFLLLAGATSSTKHTTYDDVEDSDEDIYSDMDTTEEIIEYTDFVIAGQKVDI